MIDFSVYDLPEEVAEGLSELNIKNMSVEDGIVLYESIHLL